MLRVNERSFMFFNKNKKLIVLLLALGAPLYASQLCEKHKMIASFFSQGKEIRKWVDFVTAPKPLTKETFQNVFSQLDIDKSTVNSGLIKDKVSGEVYRAVTVVCHYKNFPTEQNLPKVIIGRIIKENS